ncbi:hypothetical protein [Synechococcus sp. CCAP 1479/9]|uniref:hypothetical protein n=1 Tax=Synechococcus sp. CCAP 1479/9 TaxID=1221593 RepID=UPI001C2336F1|nr:hypothetical protein [Synechococcus sp. CCAP 1479/9]
MAPTSAELLAALDAAEADGTLASSSAAAVAAAGPPLPQPGLRRTGAILQRFAAALPGHALPQDPATLPLHLQMALRDVDPQLFAVLLTPDLPADLEAQLLNGTFPAELPPPPSPEEQRAALVQELTAGGTVNPFLPGGNLSAQIRLAQVDPVVAEQLRLAAQPLHQAAQQQAAEARQAATIAAIEEQNAHNLAEQQARARQHFGLEG